MPNIDLIPEVFYEPLDPIHHIYDNMPLKAIIERQKLINLALDNVLNQTRGLAGNQGTPDNRINQSIENDGSLKSLAVDSTLHSIESHTDTENFVRMKKAESTKLANIANNATNLFLTIYTDNTSYINMSSGNLNIKPSSTVTPVFESPNILRFNLNFPEASAHQHYYNVTPISVDPIPDYQNYKVNNSGNPNFIDGSLRIYVNGVRIFEDQSVYVPGSSVEDAWTLMYFSADAESGTFTLSTSITSADSIKIDYDQSF